MHGVQPNANAAPMTGAAQAAPAPGRGWKRSSRPRANGRSRVPANISTASTSTIAPPIRVIETCWRASAPPSAVADSPSSTKTTPNPAAKAVVPPSTRPRLRRCSRSVIPRPVATDRYTGTRGRTQGEANETTPAANTSAISAAIGPSRSKVQKYDR